MNIIDTLNSKQKKLLEIVNYQKDTTIFYEQNLCTKIGIILTGEIKIVTYLLNGNEVIYNNLKQDDIFGNNLIFSSSPYYKGNVITVTDAQIAYIKANDLFNILKNNDDFLLTYLKMESDFTKLLNNKIKLLSIDNAIERFNYYMHINNNEIAYTSITELAKKLYLQRETLSRLINKLEKNKVIKRNNDKIIILK